MNYEGLEYFLSVEDWESVAAEMKGALKRVSLECFSKMLEERRISRSKWVEMFLNTGLHKECNKFDKMLRMILKHTWEDLEDDLRWPLVPVILSINGFKIDGNGDSDCLLSVVEFVSEYINVSRNDVARVIDSPCKISVGFVIAECPGVQ
jgi:hypothetical protein